MLAISGMLDVYFSQAALCMVMLIVIPDLDKGRLPFRVESIQQPHHTLVCLRAGLYGCFRNVRDPHGFSQVVRNMAVAFHATSINGLFISKPRKLTAGFDFDPRCGHWHVRFNLLRTGNVYWK
jgi:hypothetical protein